VWDCPRGDTGRVRRPGQRSCADHFAVTGHPAGSGTSTSVSATTFQQSGPSAGLAITIYPRRLVRAPTGSPLYGCSVSASSIGGSPTTFAVQPNITVTAGARCAIVIAAVNTNGMEFSDENPYAGGAELCQGVGGAWTAEANRDLKSSTTVR
jgi:hypothetical protein